jgi:hypothetical protein
MDSNDRRSKYDTVDSIKYGVNGIISELQKRGKGLTQEEIDDFQIVVSIGNAYAEIYHIVGKKINELDNPNELIISALSEIHDGWVRKHEYRFGEEGRDKKYQHMPLELIGFKEAKIDLLFLSPILEFCGVTVNLKELEQAYNAAVIKFFQERGITTSEDLVPFIQKGAEFYKALEGQDSITTYLANPDNVRTVIIPSIEDKGIGSVEKFIAEHKKSITPEEIKHATSNVSEPSINSAREKLDDDSSTIGEESISLENE